MKKLIFILFILIPFGLISQENGEIIDKQWVKIKKITRQSYRRMKRVEIDSLILDSLEKSDIAPEMELIVAELLQEIIEDSTSYGKENALKSLHLLANKFQDKRHFFNVSAEFCYKYPDHNPLLVSKIFEGLKINLDGHYEDNMRSLKIVYEAIRPTFIGSNKGGEIEYGTETVIMHLIAYLREYIKLVDEGKIKEDPKKKYIISYMYRDLELNERTSNFIHIEGAQELKKEYFFLQEKSKDKNE